MPLPANGTPWPPKQLAGITDTLRQWSAWYEGTPEALNAAYSAASVRPAIDRPAQYRGGIGGAVARMFWGRPVGDLTRPRRQLHVPLAADICQASADLLFAEPPTVTAPQTGAQERLNVLSDDGLHSTFAEAAEVGAALGGVFLRCSWDPGIVPGRPFLTAVHADAAVPEFRWGRLTAVTFWWVVAAEGQTVWRHLERHELDGAGLGLVLHGLYQGTADNLGRPVPLTDQPATAPLADEIGADGAILAGRTPGLCVEYVPNLRPQRRWRNHPLGANLGRSDLDGIEPLMDQLDAAWTSWMRDLDLGRARVIAAKSLLEDQGPGRGAALDLDAELFTPVNALASGKDGQLPLTAVQFAIRVEEHSRTVQELTGAILRSAGYSAQTFGELVQDANITATEVYAREKRSLTTRDRKIRVWRPALGRMLPKLLTVDAALFGGAYDADGLMVQWPDAVQTDPESLARTGQMLRAAEAASTETLVTMQHPDWSDEQVADEVAAILAESGRAVPDPIGVGENLPGADPAA